MRCILFIIAACCLGLFACSSAKKRKTPTVTQGIAGQVTLATGNQMPMKGGPGQNYNGILTTVYFYEPTNTRQVNQLDTSPLYTKISTKQVASVKTDSAGRYAVFLPAGTYSVFVKRGDLFFANLFDSENNISLWKVEEGKVTTVNIVVNDRAVY